MIANVLWWLQDTITCKLPLPTPLRYPCRTYADWKRS